MRQVFLLLLILLASFGVASGQCADPCEPYGGVTGSSGFGQSVAIIGDLNDDGVDDYIVGEYNASGIGHAFVYSGIDDELLFTHDGADNADMFGFSVSGAGLIDNDLIPDYMVGAYGATPNYGAVYVYSGADGTQIGSTITDGTYNRHQRFGYSLAAAGHWDDGTQADIIIGAPWPDYYIQPNWYKGSGRVYVMTYLNGQWSTLKTLSKTEDNILFGYSVAGGGNLYGVDFDDIIVGAPHYGTGELGRVYAISGDDGITMSTITGTLTGEHVGNAVDFIGDLNNNNRDEVVVSYEGIYSPDARVRVFSMDGSVYILHDVIFPSAAYVSSVAGIYDINRDGFPDFAVGQINGALSKVSIYSGDPNVSGHPLILSEMTSGFQGFGRSVDGSQNLASGAEGLVLVGSATEGKAFTYDCTNPRQWFVSSTGNDDNNGCSDNPFASISKGITMAQDNDTVVVMNGTYTGVNNRALSFAGKQIVVMSQNGPSTTIIDCELAARGFSFINDEGPDSKLIGFTIENGSYGGASYGGGIYIYRSSPIIDNCVIRNCLTVQHGGSAIYIEGLPPDMMANPEIINCTFEYNIADPVNAGGSYWGGYGGAIKISYGIPIIDNCTFLNNSAVYGAGIYLSNTYLGEVQITNCLFKYNSASHPTESSYGGALWLDGQANVQNCTFIGNQASFGAVLAKLSGSSQATLSLNIMAYNNVGSLIHNESTSGTISAGINIYWQNSAIFSGLLSCDDFNEYSRVLNPLFCDFSSEDYSISSYSYGAPANNISGQVIGAFAVTCGTQLATGTTLELPLDNSQVGEYQPLLDWADVSGATVYEVWMDGNSYFCDASKVGMSSSEWQVSPALTAGIYYWKVRAQVGSEWTQWSATWSFEVVDPPVAPILLLPVDGQVWYTYGTHVTLDWEDGAGGGTATSYNVLFDNSVLFEEPVIADVDVTESTWLTPSYTSGTFYWKVRAQNAAGYGPWSEVRWFRLIKKTKPSCPVLFTYDGVNFVDQNPLLTACEKSGYVDIVTDYYHLDGPIELIDGMPTFQLREMEDEITQLHDIELITVDHSTLTKIACSVDGNISAYETTVAPLSAVDHNGADWLEELAASDGNLFEIDGPGHLIVTFPSASGKGSGYQFTTEVKPRGCVIDREDEMPEILKILPGNTPPQGDLVIERLNGDGGWTVLTSPPSRDQVTEEIILANPTQTQSIQTELITLRLSWQKKYSTDAIVQIIPSDEEPIVQTWKVSNYDLSQVKTNSSNWNGFVTGNPLVLKNGDTFEFSFGSEALEGIGMTRDYVIKAVGKYQPDYSVYADLLPSQPQLEENYPNPFNPVTTISYVLPVEGQVRVEVFNVLGQSIKTLVDDNQVAGRHQVLWDSRDNSGSQVASGIYFYRLTAGDYVDHKQMVLLK